MSIYLSKLTIYLSQLTLYLSKLTIYLYKLKIYVYKLTCESGGMSSYELRRVYLFAPSKICSCIQLHFRLTVVTLHFDVGPSEKYKMTYIAPIAAGSEGSELVGFKRVKMQELVTMRGGGGL